ncbi:MAG: hypothetical protein HY231_19720 [Acidobacteria bacterium]|nr:hypothetical protein [Acidobacteriota bacterium]
MRRIVVLLLFLSLGWGGVASAQKGKKPRPKASGKTAAKTAPSAAPMSVAPIIGATVLIQTKGGDTLTGEVLDLNAFSVRLRANNMESVIPFESIAALSFDTAKRLETTPLLQPAGENFLRELNAPLKAFQLMNDETRTGSSYTDYDDQLIRLRRVADKFLQKYSASDNQSEARILALLAGAIIDYNAARTVWTLKIGTDGTLSETETLVADVLALYPEMRTAAVVGNRFNADKLVGGLWKRATEKIERVRLLLKSR